MTKPSYHSNPTKNLKIYEIGKRDVVVIPRVLLIATDSYLFHFSTSGDLHIEYAIEDACCARINST
jgi:hypothetical protein